MSVFTFQKNQKIYYLQNISRVVKILKEKGINYKKNQSFDISVIFFADS